MEDGCHIMEAEFEEYLIGGDPVMLNDATDSANRQSVGASQALEVRGILPSRLTAVKYGREDAGLIDLSMHLG